MPQFCSATAALMSVPELVESGWIEAEAGGRGVTAVAQQRRRGAIERPDDVHPARERADPLASPGSRQAMKAGLA